VDAKGNTSAAPNGNTVGYEYLDAKGVQREFAIGRTTLHVLRKERKLSASKLGGKVLYRRDDIRALLAARNEHRSETGA
jgi:hypothetical protein